MINRLSIFIPLLFVTAVLHSNQATASGDWKLIKEKRGTNLFERKVKGSEYSEYKAVKHCNASVEALLEVLIDVDNYNKWLPACIEAKRLKLFDKDPIRGNFLIYLVIDAQWPVQNRDFIIRSKTTTDWTNGIVEIRLKSTDKYGFPPRKGRFRVDVFSATFRFEYISRNETKVTYMTHSESGGKAPLRLVANINRQLTLATVKKLGKIAQDDIYKKRAMRDFN